MIEKEKLHIETFAGWGDCIFSRGVIRELCKTKDVYLETPLPDMFRDLPVKFIHTTTQYRTQAKIKPSDKIKFTTLPIGIKKIKLHYDNDLISSTVMAMLLKQCDLPLDTKLKWDLPDFSDELNSLNLNIPVDKKLAIVRPATIRAEWKVITRPPNPQYLYWASHALVDYGYHVISVADLEPDVEWLHMGQDVFSHQKFYKGEVTMYALLELMKKADIVVGGSGFIVPAAVSANTNLFLILGGRLSYDGITKIIHPTMNLDRITWAMPANPCRCAIDVHPDGEPTCNKYIPDIDSKFMEFMRQVNRNQTLS